MMWKVILADIMGSNSEVTPIDSCKERSLKGGFKNEDAF